ncbi:NADPH-dependent FMN reductase [Streptomyces parvus]|uniref:NAD(P)H-dependent oxidoreductase n=1 Tax=Streptomyces parvus TaxID=66428 RepID=A0A5D4JB22_9ACTN|nr:NAD(P)H-dependent oxidoreductase [Streptomyces parvus]TYR62721.1 NAD(P)H-dependent oxidoreductase [Streptomyces parvus]
MNVPVPEIVLLSGSLGEESKTNRIASWCALQCGPRASTTLFTGADLEFPFYRPHASDTAHAARRFLAALERADGVVIVSPTYHGTTSGLLKNALDYVNELAQAPQPYLDGRALGCVSVGLGEQGAASTLQTLRTVGHALRGWPTPMGVALSNSRTSMDEHGAPFDEHARAQLKVMLQQVLTLARLNARRRANATAAAPNTAGHPEPASAGGTR